MNKHLANFMEIKKDSRVIIHPTTKCFDVSIQWINKTFLQIGGKVQKYRLVHGICIHGPNEEKNANKPYAHAWIERPGKNLVIDFGFLNGELVEIHENKNEAYKRLKVIEATIYTIKEAASMRGTFPPWKLKYAQLCKNFNPFEKHDFNEQMGTVWKNEESLPTNF